MCAGTCPTVTPSINGQHLSFVSICDVLIIPVFCYATEEQVKMSYMPSLVDSSHDGKRQGRCTPFRQTYVHTFICTHLYAGWAMERRLVAARYAGETGRVS